MISTQGKTQPIKPIIYPIIGHKITLVSALGNIKITGNITVNPIGTKVAFSLTEDKESCSASTVGEHCVRDCKMFTKDKGKYKLKTMDLTKKCMDKFRQAARKGNITVSEVSSVPELTYSVEQVQELLGI